MNKFKVGDKVKVLSGKDKGREGEIEKVFPKSQQVLIPEINVVKKHVKGFQGQKGGIYDLPKPIALGKIGLICPNCKKVTRVGIRGKKEERVRFCKKCGREIGGKK